MWISRHKIREVKWRFVNLATFWDKAIEQGALALVATRIVKHPDSKAGKYGIIWDSRAYT